MGKTKYIIIAFISGAVLCYFVMPSKTIVKTKGVTNEKDKKTIQDLESQINILQNTNKKLSEKTHTIIIERPDGSKRTEIKTESDLFETKTKELKAKYESQIEDYQREISHLKEKEKIEINKKRFGVEFGILVSKNYYIHINADVFGPIYLGIQTQLGRNNTLGAGLGIRL